MYLSISQLLQVCFLLYLKPDKQNGTEGFSKLWGGVGGLPSEDGSEQYANTVDEKIVLKINKNNFVFIYRIMEISFLLDDFHSLQNHGTVF